jgi:hypothetical protein
VSAQQQPAAAVPVHVHVSSSTARQISQAGRGLGGRGRGGCQLTSTFGIACWCCLRTLRCIRNSTISQHSYKVVVSAQQQPTAAVTVHACSCACSCQQQAAVQLSRYQGREGAGGVVSLPQPLDSLVGVAYGHCGAPVTQQYPSTATRLWCQRSSSRQQQ